MKTRLEISAGGVVYRRPRSGEPEVCLIATQGRSAWQLPKGLVERDERPERAATREVSEETGLQGELEGSLGRIEYWYIADYGPERERVHKFVDFFLFRCTGGATDDHDEEVDEARWFPLSEACETLSFKGERGVLERAAELIGGR